MTTSVVVTGTGKVEAAETDGPTDSPKGKQPMAKRNKPVLPGQSRSTACSKTCLRLSGHKGDHRSTLNAPATVKASPKPRASKAQARSARKRTTARSSAVRWSKANLAAFKAAVADAVAEGRITASDGLSIMADAITEQAAQNAKSRARRMLASA